jgi:hypothetical protein
VKAKKSATVSSVRGLERKEAANVNIAVEPERERVTIAKEADKSKLSGLARYRLQKYAIAKNIEL